MNCGGVPAMRKALAILALFVLQVPCAAFAADTPVHIRLSTQTPPNMPVMQVLRHFKERVEAESKGGVAIEIFDSGKLYSDDEIGKAVTAGAVEMGYVNLAQYANIVPGVDIFQAPFLFNSEALLKAARAPGSEIRRIIDDAIETDAQARVLWWVSQGQMVMLSHGPSLANPDRIAGKTVRAAGPVSEAFVASCGGNPKKIQVTDMPRVYEQHEVDVGVHAVMVVAAYKLWTVFDTITRTNHASAQYVVAVNGKFWKGLTKEQQSVITVAARAADIEAASQTAENEAAAYEEIARNGHMKVAGLTGDELILWRMCSSDVLTQFMDKTGSRGSKLMAAYARLQTQPRPQGSAELNSPERLGAGLSY
jgi:TRAP-type C4-dicarboxylate transport system substrate-binding protein